MYNPRMSVSDIVPRLHAHCVAYHSFNELALFRLSIDDLLTEG